MRVIFAPWSSPSVEGANTGDLGIQIYIQSSGIVASSNNNQAITDAQLKKAFELAYFILRSKEFAGRAVVDAFDRLETVAKAQTRRYHYEPTGRSSILYDSANRARNLIILNDNHLLQRLVYEETEKYEREIEKDNKSVDENIFIVHFIKHLIGITLKHNSFYVTIGLTRLLYNYSTAQALEVYNLIVQDPSRVKDDYYWRSRKARLMRQIRERFGPMIDVIRVARGEERFVTHPDPTGFLSVVGECLERFVPWDTQCPLPPGDDPVSGEIASLAFSGSDPDEEHPIEIKRMHAILHPNCFRRIISGLNYPDPDERLEIPELLPAKEYDNSIYTPK